MSKKLRHIDLINILKDQGFVVKRHSGNHAILHNPEYSNTIIVLPAYKGNALVSRSLFHSIEKHLVSKGVIPKGKLLELFKEYSI